MELKIPQNVQALMEKLTEAGYEAWAVGGCVRDSLLGREPHDWDLCTTALPAETAAVFRDCSLVRSGEKHGTIAVCTPEGLVEITTLRTEGGYTDGRRPDWVKFVPNLEDDLARRDFTINAMAFSPKGGLQDPFGGPADLKKGILRAVGEPEARFREDGLRILRGLRFLARFSLEAEEKTREAMLSCAPLLEHIAAERIFAELTGALPYLTAKELVDFSQVIFAVIPELRPCLGFCQYNPHHSLDVYQHIAHVVEAAPKTVPLRLAALLHDVGKPQCFLRDENGIGHFHGHAQVGGEMAEEILTRLRCPSKLKEQVVTLVLRHGDCRRTTEKGIRRLLRKLGPCMVWDLLALDRADSHGKPTDDQQEVVDEFEALLNRVLAEDTCFSLRDLAVNGGDLMALGIPAGPKLGEILQELLIRASEGELPNEKAALLQAAEKMK